MVRIGAGDGELDTGGLQPGGGGTGCRHPETRGHALRIRHFHIRTVHAGRNIKLAVLFFRSNSTSGIVNKCHDQNNSFFKPTGLSDIHNIYIISAMYQFEKFVNC